MTEVKMTIGEEEMKALVKDFLCLDNGSTWQRDTIQNRIEIKFCGNIYTVQKAIYDWLSIPPRRNNFELFCNNQVDLLPRLRG